MKYRIDDSTFCKIVANSNSIRQVLLKTGHAPQGGNYETIHRRIEILGISTEHFLGQASNGGHVFGPQRPLSDYIVKDGKYRIRSTQLKERLIKEGVLKPICSCCGLYKWIGQPIHLELEHKDGDRRNNLLENLRLFCPNCHSYTITYRGRKLKTQRNLFTYRGIELKANTPDDNIEVRPRKKRAKKVSIPKRCLECNKVISKKAILCRSCATKNHPKKINWPSMTILIKEVSESSLLRISKKLGVSDKALKKHMRVRGYDPPRPKPLGFRASLSTCSNTPA